MQQFHDCLIITLQEFWGRLCQQRREENSNVSSFFLFSDLGVIVMYRTSFLAKWLHLLLACLLIFSSHVYLQWCQNHFSLELAYKFAFEWHTEKFLLGSVCLAILYFFLSAFLGSYKVGSFVYVFMIGLAGFVTSQKMNYRNEPFYPDDIRLMFQFQMFRDLIPNWLFWLLFIGAVIVLFLVMCQLILSLKRPKWFQVKRLCLLCVTSFGLVSLSQFNQEDNIMRQAYNKTALWIPYSQEMNYYNVGFVGGFLYNLFVPTMEEVEGYSQEAIEDIVARYNTQAKAQRVSEEKPNIIYVMSESFADPSRLNGITLPTDPLTLYREQKQTTISGQMLSQGYGGGTANIEFEALTGFSMSLLAPQMTTPYTMLVPKLEALPSIVSFLNAQEYETTAIHPYDTSMYKRKEVYTLLGFDDFYDQTDFEEPIRQENNPYISDQSAYEKVVDQLKETDVPQFVHLVTMQTHMPYGTKYDNHPYKMEGFDSTAAEDYLEDIHISSEAFVDFLAELKTLDKRTLVVFWGDHLPGIYDDTIKAQNEDVQMHLTDFMFFDSKQALSNQTDLVLSPYYFAPELLVNQGLSISGFYELLHQVAQFLPAEENNQSYQQGKWEATRTLTTEQAAIFRDYQMITYDILAGKQYSRDSFFKAVN